MCVREEMCVKCFMKKRAVHYLEDLCFVVCICLGGCFGGLFFGCILLFYIYLDVTRGKGGEKVLCWDIITVIKHDNGKCDCQMSEAIFVYYKECTPPPLPPDTHTHTHTHTHLYLYI